MDYEKIMQEEYQRGQKTPSAPLVCPEMKGEKCKLCELCHEVYKHEKRKDSPLREKASQYSQKKKYYSNIIFPTINTQDIKLFEYGEKILRKLLNAHMDDLSEYKNFFNADTGRNLYIIKYPAPNKRNTDYGVEFRIQATPIPAETLNLCRNDKLYKLEYVLDYINQGVVVFRQGDLNDGRNEVRILPSWLGPTSSMFFFVMKYHFVAKDEFDAIQAGKMNPFKDEIVIPQPKSSSWGAVNSAASSWGDGLLNTPKPESIISHTVWGEGSPPVTKQLTRPMCFGTFEDGNPLCSSKCDPVVMKDCSSETSILRPRSPAEKNITASKLYAK